MAGDYIPFDHDFPEKPETLAIFESTGVAIGEIMLRLHKFWRTVDRQTDNGVLSGVGLRFLALICGGDSVFWEAIQAVGWLDVRDGSVVMPGFKERLGGHRGSARQRLKWSQQKRKQRKRTSANVHPMSTRTNGGQSGGQTANQNQNQNQNQNHISEQEPEPSKVVSSIDSSTKAETGRGEATGDAHFWEDVRRRANDARSKMGLAATKKGDRSLMLKVCALVASGKMPEDWPADAIEALRQSEKQSGKQKDKPWGYFYKCLARKADDVGENFNRLLAGVTIPEGLLEPPTRKPEEPA